MRVGVIGTGAMGRPIAVNCLAAGHSVIVYNRTRARADELQSFAYKDSSLLREILTERESDCQ